MGNSGEPRDELLWFYTRNYSQLTPPPSSGSGLFETNTQLIERVIGPFLAEKLTKNAVFYPSR